MFVVLVLIVGVLAALVIAAALGTHQGARSSRDHRIRPPRPTRDSC